MASNNHSTDRSTFLAKRYGGKKAFVKFCWHALRLRLGAYRRYRRIEWQQVSRLVFVCKGNICRSAFAQHRLIGFGMQAVSVGLAATTGTPADERAAAVAGRLGTRLHAHRSTHIAEFEFRAGDLLIGFEPWHGAALRKVAVQNPGMQVTLLGLWSTTPSVYLQDPYGMPEAYFETCFRLIDSSLQGLLAQLKASQAVQSQHA